MGYSSYDLREFQQDSARRASRWHPGGIDDWTLSDWFTALAGEVGELGGAIKEHLRNSTGAKGKDFAEAEIKQMISDELADVIAYAAILAEAANIDLHRAVINKFNYVSEKHGFPERAASSYAFSSTNKNYTAWADKKSKYGAPGKIGYEPSDQDPTIYLYQSDLSEAGFSWSKAGDPDYEFAEGFLPSGYYLDKINGLTNPLYPTQGVKSLHTTNKSTALAYHDYSLNPNSGSKTIIFVDEPGKSGIDMDNLFYKWFPEIKQRVDEATTRNRKANE